jgi:general secretion pathway protein D
MKTIPLLSLLGALALTPMLATADEPATTEPAEPDAVVMPEIEPAPAAGETVAAPVPAPPPEPELPILLPNGEPGLRMNFRDVPLDLVLNYLSEAAGFIIILETRVTGRFDAWSNQPLSKDEAVDLLNTVLKKNGYAAIRRDRTLTIVGRDEVKTRDIPVILEGNPDRIPKTDEIVTQIIPVRFVDVSQLLKDLQPLVSLSTTMTANEAGNSLIITDSRANINRVAQIIKAIDMGAETVMQMRHFQLEFADPTEMAALLNSLFADDGQTGGQGQNRGGQRGAGGGPGARFQEFFRAASGGGDGGGQSQRIRSRTKVTAVADPRTSSVMVSAAMEMMPQIEDMIQRLDANPARTQKVYVYEVDPGDVAQVQQVLKDMFETTNTRNTRNTGQQNNVLQNRATQNQTTRTGNTTFGGGQNRQQAR